MCDTFLFLHEAQFTGYADFCAAFAALITDLSKASDCFSHDLFIAKLHAYGDDLSSLKLLQDYLLNDWQGTKVDSKCRSWKKIIFGVPQGSVLCVLYV